MAYTLHCYAHMLCQTCPIAKQHQRENHNCILLYVHYLRVSPPPPAPGENVLNKS